MAKLSAHVNEIRSVKSDKSVDPKASVRQHLPNDSIRCAEGSIAAHFQAFETFFDHTLAKGQVRQEFESVLQEKASPVSLEKHQAFRLRAIRVETASYKIGQGITKRFDDEANKFAK